MYSSAQNTDSVFLPFVHPFGTKGIPLLRATVGGMDLDLPVDTGSTGLLIGAPLLPEIGPDEGTPVHHYFTSSNILYRARLVELSVTFHGPGGSNATAEVPVLVVDESEVCPWYDPNVDTFECPYNPNHPKPVLRDTSKITYMGVGFGRNGLADGQPSASPRANPFLNIIAINGKAPPPSSFGLGYTISTQGVTLGLTRENTEGFSFMPLKRGKTHHEDPRDWAMVEMCFSVAGQGNNCGTALIDTGIEHMYLRTDVGVETPNITIRNPKKDGFAKWVRRVSLGTPITVGFPSLDDSAPARYSFTVGQQSPLAPSHVIPEIQRAPPYINTGRNFLFGYSIAFDAFLGRFGFRPVTGGSSSKRFKAEMHPRSVI
ncbi:uncharacterized protein EI97DRAFT_388200 [Westerdykella ornata]|uniref:Acid protease n=1 Tax=Westerdykella ornata TaxID=318751 RepID=A0A6A6J4I0_WESOR|nr:uncharacterized protein EI97DRAFT_388200 [Westerdykella ornata]KAF2271302.1 hypothetical protein EI97DRAFT_388200 [Westerdykella ornata]